MALTRDFSDIEERPNILVHYSPVSSESNNSQNKSFESQCIHGNKVYLSNGSGLIKKRKCDSGVASLTMLQGGIEKTKMIKSNCKRN
jgi:hypothetical protein